MSSCPFCGASASDTDRYCTACGTDISNVELDAPEQQAETAAAGPPATLWRNVIIVAAIGWMVVLFSVTTLPDTVWGVLFFACWIVLPIAMYLDSKATRTATGWPKYHWAYIIPAAIWLVAVLPATIYLWQRSRHTTAPSTPDSPDQSPGSPDSESRVPPTDEQKAPSTAQDSPTSDTGASTNGATESATLEEGWDTNRATVTYEGERYSCERVDAPNDSYTVAFADGSHATNGDFTPGHVFLFADETLVWAREIDRPNAGGVSNDGTVAIADWTFEGWTEDPDGAGRFYVITRDGETVVRADFDSNLAACTISPDGAYAATTTFNPDCSTYIFDAESGTLSGQYQNESNMQAVAFVRDDDEWLLEVALTERDAASFALDTAGEAVWHNDTSNLRGDVEEMLDALGDEDRSLDAESDLLTVARRTPDALVPHVDALVEALESNTFSAYDDGFSQAERVLTPIAKSNPEAFTPQLESLFTLVEIRGPDPRSEAATEVLTTLSDQHLDALADHDTSLRSYLTHEAPAVRRRGAAILRPRITQLYDEDPTVAVTLAEQLSDERDLETAVDFTRTLQQLVDGTPTAIDDIEPYFPDLVTLVQRGDPIYEYGDVDTYDYRDDHHYNTYQLHKTAPKLLSTIADHDPEALLPVVPTLLEMLQAPGTRNGGIRRGGADVLRTLFRYPTADIKAAVQSRRAVFESLLESDHQRVATVAVEALFVIGDAEAEARLRDAQSGSLAAGLADRAVETLSASPAGDITADVSPVSLDASDAVEAYWYRSGLQAAYEHLESVGSARKSEFIEAAYPAGVVVAPDESSWWRAVRGGLKKLPEVELSGNTYRCIES
jgi:hypothetical protein